MKGLSSLRQVGHTSAPVEGGERLGEAVEIIEDVGEPDEASRGVGLESDELS